MVLLTAGIQAAESESASSGLSAALVTSVGTYLDPEDSRSAITLEPELEFHLPGDRALSLYSVLERPLSPYENYAAPRTILTFAQGLSLAEGWETTAGAQLNAVNLHRWSDDGPMLRMGLFGEIGREVLPNLTVSLRLSPYVQGNRYAQDTAGENLTRYGLTEQIHVAYSIGRVSLDLVVSVGQRYNGASWRNEYSTTERVTFAVTEAFAVGVSHGLLSSLVDDTTGFYRPVQVFDERGSWVSAFAGLQL